MARKPPARRGRRSPDDDLRRELLRRMAAHDTVEGLHDHVILPFVLALEEVCAARGYVLNVYGERANLAFSTPEDAEVIYQLIEDYLAQREG